METSSAPRRILWLGTYERDYPRTRVLVAGLRGLGVDVLECHEAVWERSRHKASLGLLRLGALGGRFAWGWLKLPLAQRRIGHVDAIVAGYLAQPDALLARLVALARRSPLVVDAMVSLEETLAGDRSTVGRTGGRLLGQLDRFSFALGGVVMADTEAHARWFAERYGVPQSKLAVVPVGADPRVFRPTPAPAGPPRALFYGKLAPLHGVETIVEAARMPGVPPILLIGEGQLSGWLTTVLAHIGDADIEHRAWVPYEELGAVVAASAICLGVFGTSAKAARVVPNKVYQAMSVGRPIVTADTPASREVLTDEVDALLVPPGDPTALAAALVRLGADADLRARLGGAARSRFEETGSPEVVARRFLAAIDRLGDERRP